MSKNAKMMKKFMERTGSYDPPHNPDVVSSVSGLRLQVAADIRPEIISLKTGTAGVDPTIVENTFTSMLTEQGGSMSFAVPYLRCGYRKERGNKLFAQGKYADAIELYLSGMRAILGDGFELPVKEFMNETYVKILMGGNEKYKEVIDLAVCATNIAQCYIKMEKVVEALDWIEEVNIIYEVFRAVQRPMDPAWLELNLPVMEYVVLRVKTYQRGFTLFRQLDNTATTVSVASRGYTLANQWCEAVNGETIQSMKGQIPLGMLAARRHPDPPTVYKQEVVNPELQIRGMWQKVAVSGPKPRARYAFSSWVWGNKMYIAGGKNETTELNDMWSLDFDTFTWSSLGDLPKNDVNLREQGTDWSSKVWNDTVYLFTGHDDFILTYDLVKGRWRKTGTKFQARKGQKWPYRKEFVDQCCAVVLEDKLYVFGGDDNNVSLGTNILTVLDLKTNIWEHVSGTSENEPRTFEPNLRRQAQAWAVPEQRRFYVLFGNAGRLNAMIAHKKWGFQNDYTYDDMWSYDIVESKWRRERLRGNHPSPRTEASAIYNPTLKRAIVYGGYNSSTATAVDAQTVYSYSFYGDTFIFDPETKLWKHVLTRGFPSYRAMAQFAIDPRTGKTYLYGGYTNSEYVPSNCSGSARFFGDVWQLKLDMDGGDLREEDLRVDSRTETMGPWKRCFSCGSFGRNWMKCGGSCGGKYFFCSTECQKDSWKDHRLTHGCKKI